MTETDQATEAATLLALLERSSTTWWVVTERVEDCGSALAVLRQVAGAQPTLFLLRPRRDRPRVLALRGASYRLKDRDLARQAPTD